MRYVLSGVKLAKNVTFLFLYGGHLENVSYKQLLFSII